MAERGLTMGRHRVRTLMRLNGMRPVWRCKIVHATDSKPRVAVSSNVLNRQFEQALPNQVWVSGSTYICTHSGWRYLAVVLDLHPRKIAGWAMVTAVAIVQRKPAHGLTVHSLIGTQYASADHQALLVRYGLVGSMEPQRQLLAE